MLLRGLAFLEPAIVGHVDDHLRTRADKPPFETRHGVFKADRGNQSDLGAFQFHHQRIELLPLRERPGVFGAGLLLVDLFQERDLVHEGNGFAEDHEMVFLERLELILRRHHHERVPDAALFLFHGLSADELSFEFGHALDQGEFSAFANAADRFKILLPHPPRSIIERQQPARQGRLRPDDQIRRTLFLKALECLVFVGHVDLFRIPKPASGFLGSVDLNKESGEVDGLGLLHHRHPGGTVARKGEQRQHGH